MEPIAPSVAEQPVLPTPRGQGHWGYVLPLILFVTVMQAGPILWTVLASVTDFSPPQASTHVVGLANYLHVLACPHTQRAFAFTLGEGIAALVAEALLGALLALAFRRPFRGRAMLAGLVCLPLLLGPMVGGLVLRVASGLASGHVSPAEAVGTLPRGLVLLSDIWVWTPLFFLAGLGCLSRLPYRSPQWLAIRQFPLSQRLQTVWEPLLVGPLVVVALLRLAAALGAFGVLTAWENQAGSPAVNMAMRMTIVGLDPTWLIGRASAMGTLLVIACLLLGGVAFLISRRLAAHPFWKKDRDPFSSTGPSRSAPLNPLSLIVIVVALVVSLAPAAVVMGVGLRSPEGLANLLLLATPLRGAAINSLLLAVLTCLWATTVTALAGYGLSRMPRESSRRGMIFLVIMAVVPIALWLLAIRCISAVVGLYDSRLGLWLVQCVIAMVASAWIMKRGWDRVSPDVEELAQLEGFSASQTVYRLILPQVRGPILAAAAACFLASWDDGQLAGLLTGDEAATLPALLLSQLAHPSPASLPLLSTGVTVLILPPLLVALFLGPRLLAIATLGLFPDRERA